MVVKTISTVDRDTQSDLGTFLQKSQQVNPDIMKFCMADSQYLNGTISQFELNTTAFSANPDLLPETFYNRYIMRKAIELICMPAAVFSPFSHVVVANGGFLYEGALDSTGTIEDRIRSLSAFDPTFVVSAGDIEIQDFSNFSYVDKVAIPISGPGVYNFGHFLYDGLAVALAVKNNPAFSDKVVFVGGILTEWQMSILGRLGLDRYYMQLSQPTVFSAIIGHTMLYGHVAYPTRYLRLVFDQLSSTVAEYRGRKTDKIFLTRGKDRKRYMRNRTELEALLVVEGFTIINPGVTPFDDVVRSMRHARFVVGESGAGMANIGFCESKTIVLELQPSFFSDGWTRATCGIFGLDWHLHSSIAENNLTLTELATGVEAVYDADIRGIISAIRQIESVHSQNLLGQR